MVNFHLFGDEYLLSNNQYLKNRQTLAGIVTLHGLNIYVPDTPRFCTYNEKTRLCSAA